MIELRHQIPQLVHRRDHGEAPAKLPHRIALEVPRHVLAQVGQPVPLAHVSGEKFGVPQQHGANLPQRGPVPEAVAGERGREIPEQPWPPQAAATHDDPGAAGGVHHAQRVLRLPDVPVAEHRDVNGRHQLRDPRPVRLPRVGLLDGAPVQRDRCGALLLGDPPGVEERLVLGIDADPGLDRHRNPELVGGAHRLADDGPQPVPLIGQHATATLAGHLGHGTAEVEIDVTDGEVTGKDPRRLRHHAGVDAVELHGAGGLPRVELQHGPRLGVPHHQAARGDHLAHVEAGPLLPAQLAVGRIRHARHRRQHHWKVDDDGVAAARRVQAQRQGGGHAAPRWSDFSPRSLRHASPASRSLMAATAAPRA